MNETQQLTALTGLEEALLIIGMMAVTFGVRYPLLALAGKVRIPPAIERALTYVPVAVLTAISVPIVLKPSGDWWLAYNNPYLAASIVAILVAGFTRHLLLTIVLGMVTFFVWRVLF